MTSQANEHRLRFSTEFLSFIAELDYNSTITDEDLFSWARSLSIEMSPKEIKDVVRRLENAIGNMKKRLKRLRSTGYIVLEPEAQANHAITDGGKRIKKILKKTGKRLSHVDLDRLSPQMRIQVENRAMALDSLLNIVDNTVARPELARAEVNVLNEARASLSALTLFRR